jgi:hypothetical protein
MPYITDYILILVFGLFYYNKLVRKDVDVNEQRDFPTLDKNYPSQTLPISHRLLLETSDFLTWVGIASLDLARQTGIGKHVKNHACAVEIKIKWTIRKHIPGR